MMNLELKFPKKHVNMFLIETLKQRVLQLQSARPIGDVLQYDSVQESPMFVSVTCREAVDQSLSSSTISPLRHPVTEAEAITIIRKLVRLVFRLHRRKLVHGHLGLSNLYERADGSMLMAEHVLPPGIFVKGTPPWKEMTRLAAPEIVKGDMYGFPADIWGIGVVCLSIMMPKQMRDYETEDLTDTSVISPILSTMTPSAVSFVVQCLKIDPLLRPRLEELMLHPFLRDGVTGPTPKTLMSLLGPTRAANSAASTSTGKSSKDGSSSEEDEESEDEDDEEDEDEDEEESSSASSSDEEEEEAR